MTPANNKTQKIPIMATKTLKLLELRVIGERINYLFGLKIKAGTSYTIGQWAKPFMAKYEDILNQYKTLVLQYCVGDETTVRDDKRTECEKAINDFYETTDTVVYTRFDLKWIEDIEVENIAVLYQFMEEEEKPATEETTK